MKIELEYDGKTWTAYTENKTEGFCGVGSTRKKALKSLMRLLDATGAQIETQ